MTVFIFATLGHAWNLLAGYCGLLSFGLQVYVGLGGFTVGLLNFYGGAHVWLALPVAGVAAALFAWLLAVPVSDRFSGRRIRIPVAIAVVLWIVYELLIWSNPVWDVFGDDYVRRVGILLLIFLGALPLLRLQGAYFAGGDVAHRRGRRLGLRRMGGRGRGRRTQHPLGYDPSRALLRGSADPGRVHARGVVAAAQQVRAGADRGARRRGGGDDGGCRRPPRQDPGLSHLRTHGRSGRRACSTSTTSPSPRRTRSTSAGPRSSCSWSSPAGWAASQARSSARSST